MEINREEIVVLLKKLQSSICNSLEDTDGKVKFSTEHWNREKGGGGITRIGKNGSVIEKGGVNFSAVYGEAPDFLFREKEHAQTISITPKKPDFFATGVSIVIHPASPMVPIIHMNIRYFEMSEGTRWFGGGIDLTPHYVDEKDARFFHAQLKNVCDKFDDNYYPDFKKWADDYFYISHRNETRGIGGIFFDRLTGKNENEWIKIFNFWKEVGESFAPIYTELINRNRNKPFSEKHKKWQLLRRGRYVEFNLVYDKGTKFGLETGGRTESILMSLPAYAAWEYSHNPEENSEEHKTIQQLKKGINWIA